MKVVIGLSGGVDSSVAAWLLKEKGYDVIALFMKNWHDSTGVLKGDCPWDEDVLFAEMVAKKLKIPFHTVDLSEPYRKRVVDYMFDEYKKGRTPNPDVLCNREVKFDLFVEEAMKLGAEKVATGHYSRIEETKINGNTIYRLLSGKDQNKDQSYFLCQLSQEQLSKAMFPIGEIDKPEVRMIAGREGLATATRKDSQGICFVGKVDLPVFLQQKLSARKGSIVEIPVEHKKWNVFPEGIPNTELSDEQLKILSSPYRYDPVDGFNVGEHNGAHFFTIGQRKGLNIGGKPEPLFVIHVDVETNTLYVGQGHEHPGLNRKGLFIPWGEDHWIRRDRKMKSGEDAEMLVRIRYRQALQVARLYARKDGIFIIFKDLQRGITPGQFAAWYDKEEVIGSGVISE
ncbi:MAG: tRNA 2-thiouridine(34) synthase MnmA [Bacteroidales bacterium]|nr:tRNA 2-thiouridine(34) synthase MnmA [Bacteroidales bacterium]